MSTRTLPLDDDDAPPARTTDHLYLVLDTARPGRAARYALAGATEVVIGRGTPAGVRREGSALRVDCDDRWMSSVHARLVPERGHWTVIDPGSRNGVAVNGVRQPRATILDGDVVEAGRTVFVLGEGEPAAEPALELVVTPAERGGLVTLDPALAARFGELARIAASAVPVVIGGPTGSGKERVARAVHAGSGRKGAFVPVNCAALPAGLLESELFGHKKGAFSGAVDHHTGLVAAADGGTLFLDEIADLAPAAQAALLRVLEEKEVRAVGATASTPVDLRVVAATHADLDERVGDGTFRDDLHARLAGFELELPPLAGRRVDLGLMLGEILPPGTTLAATTARALFFYAWPRNARELVRVLERAVALAGASTELAPAHLPDEVSAAATRPTVRASDDDGRKAELVALLEKHQGNVSHVAAELGRVRSQVQRWLKRYHLDPARFR
jgi:transcriptional regulator with GAF, ATPase, and Fis domain